MWGVGVRWSCFGCRGVLGCVCFDYLWVRDLFCMEGVVVLFIFSSGVCLGLSLLFIIYFGSNFLFFLSFFIIFMWFGNLINVGVFEYIIVSGY